MKKILLFVLIFSCIFAFGQDYVSEQLRYENKIYKEGIASVQMNHADLGLLEPVIELNSEGKVTLNFDDLSGELASYYYTIIHCNADWTPSDLSQAEYNSGVQYESIADVKYSRTRYQKYIHYSLSLPNDYIKPILSGNYLLLVFENNDMEQLVLTQRFMVYEPLTEITANVHPSSNVDESYYKQEVDFVIIQKPSFPLNNPFQNVKVVMYQNFDLNNPHSNLTPVFVNGSELIYDLDEDNNFEGLNEYRNLMLTSLSSKSELVEEIKIESTQVDIFLKPDKKRTYLTYLSKQDINGNFAVRNDDNGWDQDTDADYVNVHFKLDVGDKFESGNVYVYGELSNFQLAKSNQMLYNETTRQYELTMKLKQGIYNYLYALDSDKKTNSTVSLLEGTHSETENDYQIFVYYQTMGLRYDKLVGYKKINSRTNR